MSGNSVHLHTIYGNEAKQFSLSFIVENLVHDSLLVLYIIFCKLQITVYYSVRGGFCLTLCHKTHISVTLHWQLFSAHWSWARVTTRSPLLTSPFSPDCLFGKAANFKKRPGCYKCLPFSSNRGLCATGNLKCSSHWSVPRHNALFLWPVLVFSPIDTVRCQTL